jgi:AraC family transcriptional regulator of adaptative response/methylated-DNA-[protein]-cysteine methyltransferase
MAQISFFPGMATATTEPIDQTSARNSRRWIALLERRSLDGTPDAFFYGVTTTGVVCRPTCPSRRPRRENTLFFETVRDAEKAGFRTCQRCRPSGTAPEADIAAKIDRVRRHIEKHLSEGDISLSHLAEIAGLSPFHLQRIFRTALGVSPAAYARALRAERLSAALESTGTSTVTEAIYTAGYQSPSGVYAKRNPLGMTPSERQRQGEHQHIRFSIVDSPLDRMIVAATDRGVCLIAFDESDEVLRAEVRARFAAADIVEDDAALAAHVETVLTNMTEPATARKLPLHVRATAFQQRVWDGLKDIPFGETRTYSQLAEAIGSPNAVRAVGTACGANPVAPEVPCHRVLGKDGSLTGYRWGKARKAKLLDLEKRTQATTPPNAI